LNFPEFLHREPKKEFPDSPERNALRLQDAHRHELKEMLLAKPRASAGGGSIEETDRPVVPDTALGDGLGRLAAGRGNPVLPAPSVHGLGKVLKLEIPVHGL